jgi:uncharacterized protein
VGKSEQGGAFGYGQPLIVSNWRRDYCMIRVTFVYMIRLRNRSGLVTFAMAVLLSALLKADFATGSRAYEQRDYATALSEWTPLANNGNTDAQVRVGEMFENGLGVPPNYTKASKWYRRAAEKGDAHGAYRLGVLYLKGAGVPQDNTQAVKWFRRGADQGDAMSESALALMYDMGKGVRKDPSQALIWFRKAAEKGDSNSQLMMGAYYRDGQGVPLDYTEAFKWYRLAAEQGNVEAQLMLGSMLELGKGVTQDHSQAVGWFRMAAEPMQCGRPMFSCRQLLLRTRSYDRLRRSGEVVHAKCAAKESFRAAQTWFYVLLR